MIVRHPRSTRTDTLFPYTALFRSAIGLAGHLKLGRRSVRWDDNRITSDGSTDLSTSEDVRARYAATGWHVKSCDGHDPADIRRAIDAALADDRPSLVACRTIIGFGAPHKQGTSATHGRSEERRVGKEVGSTGRTRWGLFH